MKQNFPTYNRLSPADQEELQGHIQVFLDEKYFEGCGGLELTEEMKVTIAAQACLLLLHRETDYYPRLITILVYPDAYVAKSIEPLGAGVVSESETARLGEAWRDGVVVVSWDDVQRDAKVPDDGHNVVLHEFAHQLDWQDGLADGAPILDHEGEYTPWARVLGDEFEKLRRNIELGRSDVLDEYGATNPAEFFAVATECFFERPLQLRRSGRGFTNSSRRTIVKIRRPSQPPGKSGIPGARAATPAEENTTYELNSRNRLSGGRRAGGSWTLDPARGGCGGPGRCRGLRPSGQRRLLDLVPRDAIRICAGKSSGHCTLDQDQINALLIEHARAGRIVVRLKGGDPLVFGRGAEEAEYLARQGIPFQIVPGVTAGVGVTAYAGIPRDSSRPLFGRGVRDRSRRP